MTGGRHWVDRFGDWLDRQPPPELLLRNTFYEFVALGRIARSKLHPHLVRLLDVVAVVRSLVSQHLAALSQRARAAVAEFLAARPSVSLRLATFARYHRAARAALAQRAAAAKPLASWARAAWEALAQRAVAATRAAREALAQRAATARPAVSRHVGQVAQSARATGAALARWVHAAQANLLRRARFAAPAVTARIAGAARPVAQSVLHGAMVVWRVPAVRVALAVGLALIVILGIGVGLGSLGAEEKVSTAASPSAAPTVVAAPATPALHQAAVEQELAPKAIPLALFNPITGPDRPPLPEDVHGPSGSRRTTGTPEVALTFDDGPDPHYTPAVLALLKQYRVKATFCLIGVNVIEFPELVRRIADEGHTLCNHSWGHDVNLGGRARAAIVADLSRTNDAMRMAAPHARISYYRQPGGAWTPSIVESARQLGMTSLHWDVDPKDWLKPGPRTIATTITTSTVPGAIVLMHDGGGDRRGTVEALRTILPNLTTRFSLVALPPGVDQPRLHGIDRPVHIGQR